MAHLTRRTRMKGLYPRNLPNHDAYVKRLSASDPDFWGASPEVINAEIAAERAERQQKQRAFDAALAAEGLPEITFPHGNAADYANGHVRKVVAVNGREEWITLGTPRANELAAKATRYYELRKQHLGY